MLWKKIKGFTYKTYIIFFLLLLAFLPVMTLGYYSYYTYVQHITEKVSISTNVAANQVKGRIDALLVDIRKNYMEVVEREEILWFLNQDVDYSDYTNLVDVTSNLQGNKYLMDYIDGYSIINFETQWILSNRGMYKYNELLNSQEVEALRNVQNQNLTRYLWLDHTESSKGEKLRREIVDLSGLSLVIQVPIRSTQPQGLVIININEDKLYNMMNELREGDMTILNGEGRVVYTSNEEVAQYCSVNIEKLASEESFRAKIKGSSNYIVATTDSEAIMWKYIASSNLDLVREGGNDIILLMVLLIGLMVLLIIGTKVFSGFIYGPILSLTQYVNQIMKNESIGKDIPAQKLEHREFEFLTHSITELADSKKSLEGLISNQKVQLMELFQLRLLEGDIKGDQLEAYRMQLNIVKKNYYMLVSIKLSMSSELGESTIVSEDAIEDAMRIDVVKNLPKELLDKLLIYPICNYETVSFVIGADDKEVLLSRVKESLDIFKQYVFEKYHFIINGGVSNRFEHLVDYRRAYYESIEALKQQRMWQTPERLSEVIFYGDTEKRDT